MLYENKKEGIADIEVESPMCWESEGFLLPETTFDLHTGSFESHLGLSWSMVLKYEPYV